MEFGNQVSANPFYGKGSSKRGYSGSGSMGDWETGRKLPIGRFLPVF